MWYSRASTEESTNVIPHPSYITSLDRRSKESKAKETFEKLSPLKLDSYINVLQVWRLKKGSLT
jgi:hypothetical protein